MLVIFSILVPLWFIIISLVFFYLCEVLFSGFLEFLGNFVDGRNSSKYRDVAPLNPLFNYVVKPRRSKQKIEDDYEEAKTINNTIIVS